MAGTVARVTEISAKSDTSFEDAINVAVSRASQTLRGVTAAWPRRPHSAAMLWRGVSRQRAGTAASYFDLKNSGDGL